MNRLPIRARLTLVFALAMAVVLVLAGSLVYVRVAGNLNTALDEQLRSRAQDVSALVRRDGSLKSTSGTLVEHGESFAELLSSSGGVLDSTAPGGAQSLLSQAQLDASTAQGDLLQPPVRPRTGRAGAAPCAARRPRLEQARPHRRSDT